MSWCYLLNPIMRDSGRTETSHFACVAALAVVAKAVHTSDDSNFRDGGGN
jgi:hypothetical protein